MTTIGLIRHGMTAWNNEGRLQGQQDIELDENGRRQARALAKRLAPEPWDVIVSSDLSRAKETAQLVADQLGLVVQSCDPRLRERNYGLLEGTTLDERIQKWGEAWKSLDLGVERAGQLRERGLSYIEELLAAHENRKILIVSHGGFLRQLLYGLLKDVKIDGLDNTSLSIVRKHNKEWQSILINCTAHLDEMPAHDFNKSLL